MFSISLFTNKSEDNKLDKELTDITTVTGELRAQCSILNPVIQVTNFNNAMAAVCNYAFIPDFGRYYYVTDIISIRENLWELHMRVDVLRTYAHLIRQQNAIVTRQEHKYNLLIADPLFKQQQDSRVQIKNFSCNFNDFKYVFFKIGG